MRPLAPFAAILLLLGSGQITACRRGLASVQIDEKAAGQPSRVSVGETFEVSLAETLTTGYRWRLVDGCANLLKLTDDRQMPTPTPPGAAGEHRWSFLAKAPGRCELRFALARAWESKGRPNGEPNATGKTLVFPVVIEAAR